MRILMLGWEFPPHLAGGLGVACGGLAHALVKRGHDLSFVLPRYVDQVLAGAGPTEVSQFVVDDASADAPSSPNVTEDAAEAAASRADASASLDVAAGRMQVHTVPTMLSSPYPQGPMTQPRRPHPAETDLGNWTPISYTSGSPAAGNNAPTTIASTGTPAKAAGRRPNTANPKPIPNTGAPWRYSGDLLEHTRRYAAMCVDLAIQQSQQQRFDVVHVHDWITCPAGLAVASVLGLPLVVHIHSTEFDRVGEQIDPHVFEIERRAVHAARKVIVVSKVTGEVLTRRYGLSKSRIEVVYNGIEPANHDHVNDDAARGHAPTALFLGRMTAQKGPEYFVAAAKRVLERVPEARFVMAGTGDRLPLMVRLAAEQGIGHRVRFTGLLHGRQVDQAFAMADVFVMPSVSEPFGLAALEAISHGVPVIISRRAGLTETIDHVVRTDFWDVEDLADKMVSLMTRPEMAHMLADRAKAQAATLTWDRAAASCELVYAQALASMPG